MLIKIGNPAPLEGYQDPDGEDTTLFRPMDGPTTTNITLSNDTSMQDMMIVVASAMKHLMAEGAQPTWVASDDEMVQAVLAREFGLADDNPIPDDEAF